MSGGSTFLSMDLGGISPRAVEFTSIEVIIRPETVLSDYAKAFVSEAERKAPLVVEGNKLTSQEVEEYAKYLITKRIQMVNNECKDARLLRTLYIPSYLQFVISSIGIYIDRTYGLKLIPVMDEESLMTFDQAKQISFKIGLLVDELQIVYDAMPRDVHGQEGTMATALIDGTIRAYKRLEHPAATYVTAFLGSTLRKDEMLRALYRISYDDLGFIAAALISHGGIY